MSDGRNRIIIEEEFGVVFLKVPHRGISISSPSVERALDAADRLLGFAAAEDGDAAVVILRELLKDPQS